MISAHRNSHRRNEATQLGVLMSSGETHFANLAAITDYLRNDDLLVINVSATLPSSFRGTIKRTNEAIELRLACFSGESHTQFNSWYGVLFDNGQWRTPTEWRNYPKDVQKGDEIIISPQAKFIIEQGDKRFPRLVKLEFVSTDEPLKTLYHYGKPIQYSYMRENISIFDQQNIFAQFPISVEAPSATIQLNWQLLMKLEQKGCEIVPILHGAGLSSTGDEALDAIFPLPEYSYIGSDAAVKLAQGLKHRRRILAWGTTVFRCLESGFDEQKGQFRTGSFTSTVKISQAYKPKVVQGLLTGIHEIESHHGSLMQALQPVSELARLYQASEQRLFSSHEFGDLALVFANRG